MSFVLRNYVVIFLLLFILGRHPSASENMVDENHFLIFVRDGHTVTFPCPETSPEDHIRLFIDNNYEIELSDRVTFYPAEGFQIKKFTIKDTGSYRCTIESNYITRTMRTFDVMVQRGPRPINVPEIDEYKLRHVVEGQYLSVNCSAQISTSQPYAIGWFSAPTGGKSTRLYSVSESGRTIISEELTIQNVSSAHAGVYTCGLQIGARMAGTVITVLTVLAKPPKFTNP